jgi:hypothetical protein
MAHTLPPCSKIPSSAILRPAAHPLDSPRPEWTSGPADMVMERRLSRRNGPASASALDPVEDNRNHGQYRNREASGDKS